MTDYEEGCYGDGSFGPDHVAQKVFDIATSEGWDSRFELEGLTDIEILVDLENEAIEYLNDHCSDEDHYWGYENGGFGYWRIEE